MEMMKLVDKIVILDKGETLYFVSGFNNPKGHPNGVRDVISSLPDFKPPKIFNPVHMVQKLVQEDFYPESYKINRLLIKDKSYRVFKKEYETPTLLCKIPPC